MSVLVLWPCSFFLFGSLIRQKRSLENQNGTIARPILVCSHGSAARGFPDSGKDFAFVRVIEEIPIALWNRIIKPRIQN